MKCLCGDIWPGCDEDSECPFYECGYEYCPKCDDHHRPPVCVTVIPGPLDLVHKHPDIPVAVPVRNPHAGVTGYDAADPGWGEWPPPDWTPVPLPDRIPRRPWSLFFDGPLRPDQIPRPRECYRAKAGFMVHVKPGCRC